MVILEHKEEFKQALKGYEPSDEAKQMLERIPLVIMLGVTGAGRNTIINHLVNSDKYHFIVSDTTRPPKLRDGQMEQDGVQYNFRTEDAVLEDIRNGMFLEAELIHDQQVSGTSIRELEKAAASGRIPVNEVDLGGTLAIRQAKPDAKFFFIIPPSYKEWMYRLKGREVMSDQEMANRLHTAKRVLENALATDYFIFVVNDSSHQSALDVDAQVRGVIDTDADARAREIARQILSELV